MRTLRRAYFGHAPMHAAMRAGMRGVFTLQWHTVAQHGRYSTLLSRKPQASSPRNNPMADSSGEMAFPPPPAHNSKPATASAHARPLFTRR